jgi:hypothetical protein
VQNKGQGGKPDPIRNWSYVKWEDASVDERNMLATVFHPDMNHFLPKLYRDHKTKKKPDQIGWYVLFIS